MTKTFLSAIKVIALIFLSAFTLATAGHAQPNQNGYLGKGQEQYSVFIFGDALAGGLWAGSARVSVGNLRISLNGRYREGSGLAKPRFYDWAKRLPATLESKKVDIAIVFIGTNDAQDIRRNAEYLVFNSDPWREVYTKAVTTMMNQLTKNKVAVYWVEVPPVRRPELDDKLKVIAAIHRTQAAKAGIRFVEVRKDFTNPDNRFVINGTGLEGAVIRLRSRNGIRFIKPGNDKLASIVLKQIERDIAIADGDKKVSDFPVPDPSKIASRENAPYAGPIFGSASSDQKLIIVQPENMPLAGKGQSTNVLVSLPTFGSRNTTSDENLSLSANDSQKILESQVAKDSLAASLFVKGNWPSGQPGRLDNFKRSSQPD